MIYHFIQADTDMPGSAKKSDMETSKGGSLIISDTLMLDYVMVEKYAEISKKSDMESSYFRHVDTKLRDSIDIGQGSIKYVSVTTIL